ncbi:MAG: transposase, partial [Gammaproteobacteria bacterium]
MSRRLRVHIPGGVYHVTLRGNHRQDIFGDRADRSTLDSMVRGAAERTGARILAYCWMTNHIHLVIQAGDQPLGRLMQMVGSKYARYRQQRAGTTGHLFERRYHAVLVAREHQLAHVVRYVHLNPVRAGLVAEPAEFQWSSHRQYLGLSDAPWVWPEALLSLLAGDLTEARRIFTAFCGEALSDPARMDAARDLLIRGGKPEVRLGRSQVGPTLTLDEIIAEVCGRSGLPEH